MAGADLKTGRISEQKIRPGKRFLGGVIHDITERKRAEERIKNQLDELIRRQDVFLDRANRIGEFKREVNKLDRCMGDTVEYPSQISSL